MRAPRTCDVVRFPQLAAVVLRDEHGTRRWIERRTLGISRDVALDGGQQRA